MEFLLLEVVLGGGGRTRVGGVGGVVEENARGVDLFWVLSAVSTSVAHLSSSFVGASSILMSSLFPCESLSSSSGSSSELSSRSLSDSSSELLSE